MLWPSTKGDWAYTLFFLLNTVSLYIFSVSYFFSFGKEMIVSSRLALTINLLINNLGPIRSWSGIHLQRVFTILWLACVAGVERGRGRGKLGLSRRLCDYEERPEFAIMRAISRPLYRRLRFWVVLNKKNGKACESEADRRPYKSVCAMNY